LIAPINALERDEDTDGRWRGFVNAQLRAAYAELWQRVDHWVVLQAPDFEVVRRWRDQQEQALRERQAPQAMDAQALARFIAHYERLSRHALAVLPERADTLVRLDAQREVLELRHRNGAAHIP
jgi:D-glycerate 3-kinase